MPGDALELARELISFRSITPDDGGVMGFLKQYLEGAGFSVTLKEFSDSQEEAKDTLNLYACLDGDSAGPNLCFAGHVDVVHPGKEASWLYPPFEPTIEDGILYGRGACDMKCAVACFMAAAASFVAENPKFGGRLSFLITGDEEGNAINGTRKMLSFLAASSIKIDDCLVGEPTSSKVLGDVVKIGRRGSVNFNLKVFGVQGHVAYPDIAFNPLPVMAKVATALTEYVFDEGTEFFSPTNLEVTTIDCENFTRNVIPESVECWFNVRFNDTYTSKGVIAAVKSVIDGVLEPYADKCRGSLSHVVSGESFLRSDAGLSLILKDVISEKLGVVPALETTGGTSDARFIKDYAKVVEFGMLNQTAHKVDENVPVEDVHKLYEVYKGVICKYFAIDGK